MILDFDTSLFQSDWLLYGFLIVLVTPLLIILINELLFRLNKHEKKLSPPVKLIRNIIVPLVGLLVIFTQVIGYSRQSTPVKILETFVWILVINALLAILNVVFFRGSHSVYAKANVPQLFLDIFRVLMVLLGAAIVLSSVWHVDLGGMMTALGLGSFVLGLALQDTLGNLFSGIALVYEKPFSEGDVITVGDHTGRVVEMNWRAIRLLTREEVLVVIPHLVIGQETIQNLSQPKKHHILKTNIGFSYDHPPNKIKDAIMQTCYATSGILHDPPPEVKTSEFADSQIIYELEFAIPDYMQFEEILDELHTRVWYTAKRNNLNIPLPQIVINKAAEIIENEDDQLNNFINELPSYLPVKKTGIKKLEGKCKIHHYGKGEFIIRQGGATGTLYVIMNGTAVITTLNSDGITEQHTKLSKGDFFGEITLFTDKLSLYSVQASDDVELLYIPADLSMNLVENNPQLAHYLDQIMDSRRLMVQQ